VSAQVYQGSCHCGAVRFRAKADLGEVVACNCSMCTRKAFLHVFVAEADFQLLAGEDQLTLYQFGTMTARHYFCRTCGVHPFYRARSDPDKFDVNVRCLEGVDLGQLAVAPFDGRNWEAAISTASWQR
jgi:hypothetical protein